MRAIKFTGEESARFVRLAQATIDAGIELHATVEGREPLTSRHVKLEGIITNGVLDGYLRYLVLYEPGSDVEYWIAGSNATRSIACKEITFNFTDEALGMLRGHARAKSIFIPGIKMLDVSVDPMLIEIDRVMEDKSARNAEFLLNTLSHQDEIVILEAALSLRAFASTITSSKTLQNEAEERMLATLQRVKNNDARISLVEDLGYIGTEVSVDPLSALLRDENEHNHVRWAAAIALGRLPSESVVQNLLRGLESKHQWTVVATLLSLSRRTEPANKDILTGVFEGFLSNDKDEMLRLYACLGLSRCNPLPDSALASLRDVIGDPTTPTQVRGYAALAISSSLGSCPEDYRRQLGRLLQSVSLKNISVLTQPEPVWGLEYIAELASLLELNEFSATVHNVLSQSFKDWRVDYYKSLSYYEKAEAAAHQGRGEQSRDYLEESIGALPNPASLPEDARDAINFRRDIVSARQRLNDIIYRWEDVGRSDELRGLEQELREVNQVYARYSTHPKSSRTAKQLSDRELQYLQNTRRLVDVMGSLISLDGYIRSDNIDITILRQRILNITEYLKPLQEQFSHSFASSLNDLVRETLENLEALDGILSKDSMSLTDKLRSSRRVIAELRLLFRQATWPMPARVCPVFGLGKGVIKVLREGLEGEGTEQLPFLYPKETPAILNVLTEIHEMAPGGATTALITCSIPEHERKERVPVVEGPYQCSFILSDWVSTEVSTKCTVSLRFEARDCNQIADSTTVFLRRRYK